jgi:hypothetical protein
MIMRNTFAVALLLLLSGVACFGQSSYKGLTPGKSTRADVERVLGQAVKSGSKTLVEYNGRPDANKIYVQYDDGSQMAILLRIEFQCDSDLLGFCLQLYRRLVPPDPRLIQNEDARVIRKIWLDDREENYVAWKGSPVYLVKTFWQTGPDETDAHARLGLYSKDLYENSVPKSCTGTFIGIWDTNRGRMTLVRTPRIPAPKGYAPFDFTNIKGNFSDGTGALIGTESFTDMDGEWTDSTGKGTFSIKLDGRRQSFTGEWTRTSGKGQKQGTWQGRCVDVKAHE